MPFSVNGRLYAGTGDGANTPLKPQPSVDISSYPASGTYTDRSGATSATAGTVTQVMAANTSRVGWFVQNLSTNSSIAIYYGSTKIRELDPRDLMFIVIGNGAWSNADRGVISVSAPNSSVPFLSYEV